MKKIGYINKSISIPKDWELRDLFLKLSCKEIRDIFEKGVNESE